MSQRKHPLGGAHRASLAFVLVLAAPTAASLASLGPLLGGAPYEMFIEEGVEGFAQALLPLPDGGFVVAGANVGYVAVADHEPVQVMPATAYLASYDAEGRQRWLRTADAGVFDGFTDVAPGPGGGLWVAAVSYNNQEDQWAWLFQFSGEGALRWGSNLSLPAAEVTEFRAVLEEPGGAVVVGNARFRMADDRLALVPYVVRVADDGSVRSQEERWDLLHFVVSDAVLDGAGTLHLAGVMASSGDGCMVALDATGTLAWQACDGALSSGLDAIALHPGGPVATGNLRVIPRLFTGTQQRDAAGALQWSALHDPALDTARFAGSGIATRADGTVFVTAINNSATPLWPVARFVAAWTGLDPGYFMSGVTLRYDAAGAPTWKGDLRGAAHLAPFANALDAQGRLLIAGVQIDASAQQYRPFVARYAPS